VSGIFKKLNLKNQAEILVLNAPESFESELAALEETRVRRSLEEVEGIDFALAFASRQAEVDALAPALAAKARGDALLWFAYPKASSKKYTCDFNRDTGWSALAAVGYRPVRQVAIDEDWSALRFRRDDYVRPK
jgi:hypothetical protein